MRLLQKKNKWMYTKPKGNPFNITKDGRFLYNVYQPSSCEGRKYFLDFFDDPELNKVLGWNRYHLVEYRVRKNSEEYNNYCSVLEFFKDMDTVGELASAFALGVMCAITPINTKRKNFSKEKNSVYDKYRSAYRILKLNFERAIMEFVLTKTEISNKNYYKMTTTIINKEYGFPPIDLSYVFERIGELGITKYVNTDAITFEFLDEMFHIFEDIKEEVYSFNDGDFEAINLIYAESKKSKYTDMKIYIAESSQLVNDMIKRREGGYYGEPMYESVRCN